MNEQEINVDDAQIGRVVHFVIEKNGGTQCRPAFVVYDWPDQGKPGYVNLVVFPDGTNDGEYGTDHHNHNLSFDGGMNPNVTGSARGAALTRWETSVTPNHAVKVVRSWHWGRECPRLQQPAEPFIEQGGIRVHHNHAAGIVDIHNCYACSREKAAVKE